MKIWIFGGTTEGRLLAERLPGAGHTVTVSVATKLGAEELDGLNCTVRVGRLDADEMAAQLHGFDLVVDATHPYAVEVSRNIRQACGQTGVPLRRVLRKASADLHLQMGFSRQAGIYSDRPVVAGTEKDLMDVGQEFCPACVAVESCRAAAEYLKDCEGNILIATGSKELLSYKELPPERLFPRVLPTHEALDICERMGIPHRNILALQGPFSEEMNLAMLRQYNIRYLVSKDGGRVGGYEEKYTAAKKADAVLILIRRPEEGSLHGTGETTASGAGGANVCDAVGDTVCDAAVVSLEELLTELMTKPGEG